jgi:hypothetical protein
MRSYKSPAYNFSFFSFAESGYACYKCCKFVNNSTCEVDRRIVMLTKTIKMCAQPKSIKV